MKQYLAEAGRRALQIICGCFIFDFPPLPLIRNLLYKVMLDQYGIRNTVGKNVLFYVPHGKKIASIRVESDVQIGKRVRIDCFSPIEIKDNVWISENVSIFNHQHVLCGRALKQTKNVKATEGLIVGRDAWIGAGAMVLPQVSYIGEGAVIGAGSVVTKNVKDYKIVAGNPATIIGERD